MAAANDGINGIFNIAMPRYHIHHKPTGTLLARDLYRHQQPWLLDHHSYHEVVPFGSFFEVSDSGDPQAGRLLLDREGLMPLPRDPETETQAIRFILAQDEVTRVAWEQVDIHASHYICVEGGEWELEQADDGDGVCLVAWIRYQSQKQILRAAYGRDEVEAKKRLITAAQQRLEQEAGAGSQPGQILTAKIEMEEAGTFAHTMAIGLAAKKNAVKWLFRAY